MLLLCTLSRTAQYPISRVEVALYMKNIIPAGFLILLLVFVSQPARSEVMMDYNFPNGVLWSIGGFEVYDILQRGEPIGQGRIDYRKTTMLEQPAYRAHWVQTWKSEGSTYTNDVDTKMLSKDLSVVSTTYKEKVNDQEWRYEGNYTGDAMVIGYYLPGDSTRYERSMNRKGKYCDVDILPFLLRNVPFAERNIVTLNCIDVMRQTFYTPIATITGSEVVETPTTQYDCWVVNIGLPNDEKVTAWYSKSDKHYLVKARYFDHELVLNRHS